VSQPFLSSLFDAAEREPLSVSELTGMIRSELERRFASVWVEGEISNFRAHGSGHWYFTLKDEFAQMRCACYRSSNQRIRFRLEDGMQLRARGRLSVYEPKGEYQLIVESLEPVGAGALQLAFEQTKARLQAEGFDVHRVPNGEDALSSALQFRPDLILLDVMMPKVSGFDVLDILRNTPEVGNVKVIMLTALSQDSDKQRAQQLGVDDYLVKSQVVIADVVERIKQHLGV